MVKILHNMVPHNLYASRNIIRVIKSRMMGLADHVARVRVIRNAYKILIEKPEGKRPLGRPKHRWEDNIGMDIAEIE
jgi:hypothetical protein